MEMTTILKPRKLFLLLEFVALRKTSLEVCLYGNDTHVYKFFKGEITLLLSALFFVHMFGS